MFFYVSSERLTFHVKTKLFGLPAILLNTLGLFPFFTHMYFLKIGYRLPTK